MDVKGTGTRRRLLLAAEKLFAERGIAAVSLREVNLAAGQKNTSSAHYHFGSKEALVDAILAYRQADLGQRRQSLRDELLARQASPTVRDWVTVLVQPFIEMAAGEERGGSNYLSFLSQIFLHPPINWQLLVERGEPMATSVALAVNEQLQLPLPLLRHRFLVMMHHVVHSLATQDRARKIEQPSPVPMLSVEAFGVALIDGFAAYLSAPVSPELMSLLPKFPEQGS